MAEDVCDLDRTYAQKIVNAVWRCHLMQVSEHMRQGECLKVHAPDYRAHDAAAKILAELRESYLGPARNRELEGVIMPKTKDELLKGMHRGRGNHLDTTIVDTHKKVTETHGLRAKFEASMGLLIAAVRAAANEPKEVQLELIDDFEKNLPQWLNMHGL